MVSAAAAEPRKIDPAALGVCVLGNFIDGYDVLAIAFTAPAIARDWKVGPELLGVVFSAGIAGITLGSLLLAPFAERFGRRRYVLLCLLCMMISMLGCAFANNVAQLSALRFVTGLGVGAVLPTLNSIVAEIAPPHRRNLAISIFTGAYPLGSIVGGASAALLIGEFGWRSIFAGGAAATGLVLVLQWIWLPRSDARTRAAEQRSSWRALLQGGARSPVGLLAVAFFLHMLSVFSVLNWTPRLVEQAGGEARAGVLAAMIVNFGSLVGGLSYGPLADRFGWRRIAPAYAALFAVMLLLFGVGLADQRLVYGVAAPLGFFMGGAMTSLYALAPLVFPAATRIGGTGLVIGIGRCGGILGPLLTGYGLAAGFRAGMLFVLCAAAPGLVWLALNGIGRATAARDVE